MMKIIDYSLVLLRRHVFCATKGSSRHIPKEEQLKAIYVWLNTNLPCPPFSSAGWSRDAATWFKDTVQELVKRMRDPAVLLESHELPIQHSDRAIQGRYSMKINIKP
jgi:hypothetical protein